MKGKHLEGTRKKCIGMMDIVLVFVAVTLLLFVAAMIWLFAEYGSIPDTLCTCVFAVLGGECGVMGWIKTNKDKVRDRQWEKEDVARKENEDES